MNENVNLRAAILAACETTGINPDCWGSKTRIKPFVIARSLIGKLLRENNTTWQMIAYVCRQENHTTILAAVRKFNQMVKEPKYDGVYKGKKSFQYWNEFLTLYAEKNKKFDIFDEK